MAMIAFSGLLGLPGVTVVNQVTDLETQTVTLQLAHEFDYAICPVCSLRSVVYFSDGNN